MIRLENIQTVYFLGIGGIGMSALARYFHMHGCVVSGYDKTPTALTRQLEQEGIPIHYQPRPEQIVHTIDLIIYTPAIPASHPEWKPIRQMEIPLMKRAEVLGLISNAHRCLAVAGTHGKTTTSAILAHILKSATGEVNAFVGGILSNYNTNFLYASSSQNFVVEADEFDRSFLHLHPDIAVINSVDADHLDVYGAHDSVLNSFKAFARQIKPNGHLIVKSSLAHHFTDTTARVSTFGIDTNATFNAKNVQVANGRFWFDLDTPKGTIGRMTLALPGKHNIENTVAASAVALKLGVSPAQVLDSVASFKGVKRRFEITGSGAGTVYIDDYAHHPAEITQVLNAGRELYPNKKLTVVFQPHLYSRTRDFEDEFAEALSAFDEVILLDIYPARELPIEGVSSEHLLQKINSPNKRVLSKKQVLEYIENNEFEILFTLGAGDIDTLVEPIKQLIPV